MAVRLLCVGDVHLGRSPGGLDRAGLGDSGLTAAELGPRAAWERMVEHAVEQGVDAVVLAGDVVDAEDDFYEGYGVLRAGVERLGAAGIRVLGVVGNHDVKVLPLLASQVEAFELVGAGGHWERVTIEGKSGGKLDLVGWSFPRRQVRESPLPELLASPLNTRRDVPVIGLMHGDLDAGSSTYAPVRSSDLRATAFDAWLLGHVHKPGDFRDARPSGYLGSLTALDANEIGPRGPWLLEADGKGVRLTQQVLAPLRFEELDVDVSGVQDSLTAQDRMLTALRSRAALTSDAPGPRAVGLRLRLVGRTRVREALVDAAEQAPGARETAPDGVVYFIERVEVHARAEIDLEASARRADPLGLLAAQLLVLERDASDPERAQLLDAARAQLEVRRRDVLGRQPEDALDDAALADRLRAAADVLLDALLRQATTTGGVS